MIPLLIVDDSPQDLQIASTLLASLENVEISTATDGDEALARLKDSPTTIVVTDLHMPKMNGLQLLRAVRDEFPLSPVIVMTGHGNEDVAATALNDGAAGYVPKRLLSTDLVPVVRKILLSITARHTGQRLERVLDFTETRFALDNDVELLPPVVGYLQEKAVRLLDFDENVLLKIGLAIHEAVANAIYHGNLELSSELREFDDRRFDLLARRRRTEMPFAARKVQITAQVSKEKFQCVIRDEGNGFDVGSVPDPLAPENLGRVSGRGLLLIRKFMDEVSHNGQGNEITFAKRC